MFHALATEARGERDDPIALQKLAWDLTGALTIDNRTSLLSLMTLDLNGADVRDLPVQIVGSDGLGATVDSASYKSLAAAGYTQQCRVG